MIYGKRVLQALWGFPASQWYKKAIPHLAEQIVTVYGQRNEVVSGGVVTTGGSQTATVWQIDMTQLSVILHGYMGAAVTAFNDTDIWSVAGSVGQALFTNGTEASINLASDGDSVWIALIAVNSDGAAGVRETDNFAPLVIAIVKGISTTYKTQTAYPTSQEIQYALEHSTDHALTSGWAWLAEAKLVRTAGPTYTPTYVLNRNNHLGA